MKSSSSLSSFTVNPFRTTARVTDGCGASTACGSVITELAKGKTVEGASRIKDADVLAVLGGLPEENVHCALLAANTLNAALDAYRSKQKRKEVRR